MDFDILTFFLLSKNSIFDPRDFKRFNIVLISLTLGRFLIMTGLSNKSVEAKIEFELPP